MNPTRQTRLAARQPDGARPLLMHHRWESLLFLHWRVAPELLQPTLPAGLTVDTFAGAAWLGIVPFFMRGVRPVGLPALPWLSRFQELNVRTYVHDAAGVPGVWFYSLDCDQPLAVLGARLLTGLPYCHAAMTAAAPEGFIRYTCRRRGQAAPATYRYRAVGPAREAAAESLEFFLLERYYLFARRGRSLLRAQVSHAPYRFRGAELPALSTAPAAWDGLPALPPAPDHLCAVDGLDVNIYATRRLAPAEAPPRVRPK